MRLADFIEANSDAILTEWVAFAETCDPSGGHMDLAALRDHAAVPAMPVPPSSPTHTPAAQADTETTNASLADDAGNDVAATPQNRLADGRFILLDRLGEGGNAVVWRARDRLMRTTVAEIGRAHV